MNSLMYTPLLFLARWSRERRGRGGRPRERMQRLGADRRRVSRRPKLRKELGSWQQLRPAPIHTIHQSAGAKRGGVWGWGSVAPEVELVWQLLPQVPEGKPRLL